MSFFLKLTIEMFKDLGPVILSKNIESFENEECPYCVICPEKEITLSMINVENIKSLIHALQVSENLRHKSVIHNLPLELFQLMNNHNYVLIIEVVTSLFELCKDNILLIELVNYIEVVEDIIHYPLLDFSIVNQFIITLLKGGALNFTDILEKGIFIFIKDHCDFIDIDDLMDFYILFFQFMQEKLVITEFDCKLASECCSFIVNVILTNKNEHTVLHCVKALKEILRISSFVYEIIDHENIIQIKEVLLSKDFPDICFPSLLDFFIAYIILFNPIEYLDLNHFDDFLVSKIENSAKHCIIISHMFITVNKSFFGERNNIIHNSVLVLKCFIENYLDLIYTEKEPLIDYIFWLFQDYSTAIILQNFVEIEIDANLMIQILVDLFNVNQIHLQKKIIYVLLKLFDIDNIECIEYLRSIGEEVLEALEDLSCNDELIEEMIVVIHEFIYSKLE